MTVLILLVSVGYAAGQAITDTSTTAEAGRPQAETRSDPAPSATRSATTSSTPARSSAPPNSTSSSTMPQLVGLTEDQAKHQILGASVTVRYELVESLKTDQVRSQKPGAGQPVTDEISLVVQRQARVATLDAVNAGDAWSKEAQDPTGRQLAKAVGAPADSTTKMALPQGTTVLEADLFVAVDQPTVRTVIVAGPSDREVLRVTLAPGQIRHIRLLLPEGGPLTWSTTPSGGGRIVLDEPTVWTP